MSDTTPYLPVSNCIHSMDRQPLYVLILVKALTEDQQLKHHRIIIEVRNAKNHNKNPVAEMVVQEIENELP